MQRRHFELIASVIRDLDVSYGVNADNQVFSEREKIANEFAEVLRTTNTSFDRERFLKACQPTPATS